MAYRGGRWKGGSGRRTHVHPWLIRVSVRQKPLRYCKVISLQFKLIKKKKEVAYQFLLALNSESESPRTTS